MLSLVKRLRRAISRRCRIILGPVCTQFEKVGSIHAYAASVFYCVSSSAFHREHKAVLYGRRSFSNQEQNSLGRRSLLRRNIHRIEKGLISRPRRDVFALDYIVETVQAFVRESQMPADAQQVELAWASDVLNKYFDVCDDHEVVAEAKLIFRSISALPVACFPDRFADRVPYRKAVDAGAASYSSLLALAKQRRSVRWFLQQPVPRELIHKAAEIATLSPSACNRQPFCFRVFDDPVLLRKVAALPAGAAGFDHNFPCIVVVVGDLSCYFDERDRHLIYIDGSLATMSFILALETLGLSSCCINWPDIEDRERAADSLLKLMPSQRPVMFIAVGFHDPDGLVPYSEKKTSGDLCRFNFE